MLHPLSVMPEARVTCRIQRTFTALSRSRATASPAFAPWALSGLKRIVAPLLPPVPLALSYVPAACL